MNSYKDLIDNYFKWLRSKTDLQVVDENLFEITTPYLDRHNDYIQIYISKNADNTFTLTDDGYTINDLEMSGCTLDSPRRQQLLCRVVNGNGVELKGHKILSVNASEKDFPLKKHNLIQTIIDVNNMFYLASSTIKSLFYDDVKEWLNVNDVRYSERIAFVGKSGFTRTFDFIIPQSKKAPERIIKTLNVPTKQNADNIIISYIDVHGIRPSDTIYYVLINDNDKNIPDNITTSMDNYNIEIIPWTRKVQYINRLVA